MSKFKKGESYKYQDILDAIEDVFDETGFVLGIASYGPNLVGQSFLSYGDDHHTYSFVLTGNMGGQNVYECIYSE